MSVRLFRSLVTMLSVALVALGSASFAQEDDQLSIAFDASDLTTADPHFAAATQDRAVADMVFNGLVRYRPGDITTFEPDLAVAWDVSSDGLTWTFHLREGVQCHPWNGNDGYELTSQDVVYSLRKAADPDTSAYAGEYQGMSFEATGPYTVEISVPQPVSESLMLPKVADYSGGFVVCQQAAEDLGQEAFASNPVGTGPFMFSNYVPQQETRLTANEAYFRGEPKLDGVTVRYMPSVSSREAGLETGELDVIEGPPEQPWVESMQDREVGEVMVFGPGETATLHFDTSTEPLGQLEVRRALARCIDRSLVRATVGETVTDPLVSPVPPLLAGGMTEEEVGAEGLLYPLDREAASQALADAGAEGFTTEVVVSERASYLAPMQNLQSQLTQCGVQLDLRVVDHSTMHTLIREDANQIVLYIAWRPNADVFLTRFYHSDSAVVTGDSPDTNFSHLGETDLNGDGDVESIDAIIERARGELDADAQADAWREAQLDILDWAVAYPLYIKKLVFARNTNVDFGYEIDSTLALYPQINEQTSLQ
ncbi:MAG: ABC transporter substrate-binding protein [Trueperaceae bacterium]|nr:ABC transporter substrate-binding protein [Trueperaceae bacterium]